MSNYKILYKYQEFEASEYQNKIFHNIEHGTGNLIINAAAGSSKTTTIVNAIRFISKDKKILFVAFNKDIVNKIKLEVSHESTNILTFHSLGYLILQENKIVTSARAIDLVTSNIINEYKYKNYIKSNIDIITRFKETKSLGRKRSVYINNICKLVDYSRYYLAMTPKEISKVAELYDVIPVRDEFDVCRQILLWGEKNLETIDYTDMFWLPNVLNLTTKKYQFNWVFIDEAQDTSIAEQKLIEKTFKRGTRFAAVMDSHQQINIWAGSTLDAIENFKKYPNTKDYNLPISYRCPKKIVDIASKYSDNIIASDNAIDGEIRYDVSQNDPISGDMVLCRTTAPLIELFLKYLRLNKKAYIRGFENIKKEYIELIDFSKSKLIDRNCVTADGLFPKIYIYLFEEIDRIKSTFNLDDEDAILHPTILNLYDNIESLKVLSEGLINVDELLDKINIIFNGEISDGIELSTIHKAKGLEADNVYILYPSLMPSKLATKEWEIKTEENLIYVAYTRAKKTLNFIAENNQANRTNGYFNLDNMFKELSRIRELIKYNKTIGTTENNFSLKNYSDSIPKLIENTSECLVTKSKKKNAGIKLKNLL